MSLAAQLNSFRKDLSDATTRNVQHSRPASTAPARTSTPKPGDGNKRTHDAAFTPASQPAISTVTPHTGGGELLTQVFNSIQYLKEKDLRAVAFDDLIGYLSLPHDSQKQIPLIKQALRGNERAEYIPASLAPSGKESFKYRPLHPVSNAEELKTYLMAQPTAQGIAAKELKDGWPDALAELDRLEKEGHVLLSRWKKDSTPRMVWLDSPTYHILNPKTMRPQHVDADFADVWSKTRLPANEMDLRGELEKAGLTPTSAVKEVRRAEMGKKARRKVVRKGGKTTNSHLLGILKDYSGARR